MMGCSPLFAIRQESRVERFSLHMEMRGSKVLGRVRWKPVGYLSIETLSNFFFAFQLKIHSRGGTMAHALGKHELLSRVESAPPPLGVLMSASRGRGWGSKISYVNWKKRNFLSISFPLSKSLSWAAQYRDRTTIKQSATIDLYLAQYL